MNGFNSVRVSLVQFILLLNMRHGNKANHWKGMQKKICIILFYQDKTRRHIYCKKMIKPKIIQPLKAQN